MTPEELGRLFESFTRSAFRLECLSEYRVPQDVESLAAFRAGEPRPQARDNRPWLQTIRRAILRGAQMQRVRMVETPLTEYQRFQFSWGYQENTAAGEELSILDHRPDGLLAVDFWLFDDTTAVVLEYDDAGRFLRPVVAETLAPYLQARDMALKSAVPFREYRLSMPDYVAVSRRRQGLPPTIQDDATLEQLAARVAESRRRAAEK
jgi:hypothetical protein